MSESNIFINEIKLANFLSFGDASEPIQLGSLNVLIGKNSCGKSNLIEAFALLKALPKDLPAPIRQGGGIREWLWKGANKTPIAEINISLNYPGDSIPLRYRLNFTNVGQRLELIDEAIECVYKKEAWQHDVYFYYRYQEGSPVLNVQNFGTDRADSGDSTQRTLRREDLDINQSVLSQLKDPDQYPELTYVGKHFSKIKLYREWNLGRYTPPRLPQNPDLPEDFLMEDMSNLGLVLNDLQHRSNIKKTIVEQLNLFYDEFDDITTKIHGGTVQIYLHEKNLNQPIPATRLSDGTLRFLCLLVILCHPEPPPLICIEGPELGLHPDILPYIAKLLLEASKRTQLVVTTHSDILVDELTDVPDSVIVSEKYDGSTNMHRLDADSLKVWIEKYSLGELWRSGEIGGNRW
ncbi:MAG: chromosome segregation protein SMC [Deltaproteobacteria bacterium]|nr:MAG: chromosome segregation protein SMC [Deltaproteobacteria bacterium]